MTLASRADSIFDIGSLRLPRLVVRMSQVVSIKRVPLPPALRDHLGVALVLLVICDHDTCRHVPLRGLQIVGIGR